MRFQMTICCLVLILTCSVRAEDGVTDSKIILGESTNLAGPAPQRAHELSSGSKMYFDKINAAGGIFGRKIETISLDDGYDPARTLANTKTLVDEKKVFLLYQYYGTPGVKAALPIIERKEIPLVAPFTGANVLRSPVNKNIFCFRVSYKDESAAMVEYAVNNGAKEIAVFYQDDALGSDGTASTHAALAKHGLKMLISASYKRNTLDVDAALDAILKAKPKAIILWALLQPAIAFTHKAIEKGYDGLILAASPASSNEFAEKIGTPASPVLVSFGSPLLNETKYEVIKQYLADTKSAGQNPTSTHFEGYLNAVTLAEALKQSGKNLTRQALRDAFEQKMTNFQIGGLNMSFSKADHQGLTKVFLTQIKGGKFIPIGQ